MFYLVSFTLTEILDDLDGFSPVLAFSSFELHSGSARVPQHI
jgi:hypothetical protein